MTFDARERCDTCRAFSAKAQECRRHAPSAVMMPVRSALSDEGRISVLGIWPSSRADDWCAEWKSKEDA